MPLPTGTRIGPYEVVATLGAGGMGEVYRARDSKLGRDVALKILPDTFAQDPDRIARFRREAQVLASLNHPNIAAIYGLEDAGPVAALVLELVEGPTLAEVIAGSRPGESQASGPKSQAPSQGLSVSDALPIAKQIADALEAAHERGVIHRDLKPANIKVRPDGTVKVLDFGLAKALEPVQASRLPPPPKASAGQATARADFANSPTITSPAMTALGMILGTAAYMAPEQAKGRPVDKRADIWAFGCVVYEMLTGRPAFDGDDVSDTLANILKAEPDWAALPAETPPSLRRLLRRCLSKDLNGRLSDIGGARLEIADASSLAHAADSAVASGPRETVPRSRWRDVALVVMALGLAGLSPLVISHLQEPPAVTPSAIRFHLPPPSEGTFTLSTTRSAAAVSPDGRLFAFRVARGNGQPNRLWVRTLDATQARELRDTDGVVGQPFWSPDSRSIAFAAGGQLKRLDVAGGPVQVLSPVSGFAGGAWSPDGTIVVGTAGGGLLRVPAVGGQLVPLTTLDAAQQEHAHTAPTFLPDGRRLLFAAQPGSVMFLTSLDAPDSRTRLREGDSVGRYAAPGYLLWVREGTLLAQKFDDQSRLVGDPVPIAENVAIVPQPGSSIGVFSVSTNGVLVYQDASEEPGGSPVWVDRSGREVGVVASGSDVLHPRVSPDGRSLALIRGGDLWVETVGRPPIRLTFDGQKIPQFSPLWTPDGRAIVFESSLAGGGEESLTRLPADGSSSTPTPVAPQGHFHPHGWLPNGDLVAVRLDSDKTGPDVVAITQDGKNVVRPMVETAAVEGPLGASVSPDGRWLAYCTNSTGQVEVWVRPTAGGAALRISPAGGVDPVWSRSGRELYYREGTKVMVTGIQPGQEFRSSPPVALFTGPYHRVPQPPTFDVGPDGRFLMLKPSTTAVLGSAPLTVVINWVAELTRRLEAK